MMLKKPSAHAEFKTIWLIVVILAMLVGYMGRLVVTAKTTITENVDELKARGIWMESIDEKMLDRFTGSDFDQFLEANPSLVDPRK